MKTTITIYTDSQGRVFKSQNEENTLIMHEVAELPEIPEKSLCDGYHIYIDSVFSFEYEVNANKCYAEINNLKVKLKASDYVAHKESDGEDVSMYEGYVDQRRLLRVEINRIESLVKQK